MDIMVGRLVTIASLKSTALYRIGSSARKTRKIRGYGLPFEAFASAANCKVVFGMTLVQLSSKLEYGPK